MKLCSFTKDNVTVELVDTGAKTDAGFLRLFLKDHATNKGANFLSMFPASAPDEQAEQAINMLMEVAYERILAGKDIRKLCMRLSWISPDWLKDTDTCPVCDGDGCSICAHTGQITLASLGEYVRDDDELTEVSLVFPAHEFEEKPSVEQPL